MGMMYRMYDRRGNERMTFDLFVQSCIQLKRMTDVFKRYDVDRDGYITLSFEEFLTGMCVFFFVCLFVCCPHWGERGGMCDTKGGG